MSGSGVGTVTSDGNHSRPGGGPLVVVGGANANSPNLLPLPITVTDDTTCEHRRRLNMIQLEYARDIAILQSRAYDAVLRALATPDVEFSRGQGDIQASE